MEITVLTTSNVGVQGGIVELFLSPPPHVALLRMSYKREVRNFLDSVQNAKVDENKRQKKRQTSEISPREQYSESFMQTWFLLFLIPC
jgi:hypothetical protein